MNAAEQPAGAGERAAAPRGVRLGLQIVAWFNGVSALAGMIGLVFAGGMGVPLEWIEGTAFQSYLVPGLILGILVGGTQALALVAQYLGFALAWGMHAAAGLVMTIWIFVEIAVMLVWSPLQGIYFATGLAQVVLAVLALGAWPRPFLRRAERVRHP